MSWSVLCGGGSGERPPHPANALAAANSSARNDVDLGVTDDDVPF